MTIDTRDVNDGGLAKFRTQADNSKEQICNYNWNKRDKSFNFFSAVRKQTSSTFEIIFSIATFFNETNKKVSIYVEIDNKLSGFNNNNVQYKREIQQINGKDTVGETSTDREQQQYAARNGRRVSKKPWFLSG